MPYFALIDSTNTVTQVLSAATIPTNGTWIETCKNTFCGQNAVTGVALRKNFAIVGATYNSTLNAFIPKPKYTSWILNEETCTWNPPIAYPSDQKPYKWNEQKGSWEIFE
jgi:hypothetical protein